MNLLPSMKTNNHFNMKITNAVNRHLQSGRDAFQRVRGIFSSQRARTQTIRDEVELVLTRACSSLRVPHSGFVRAFTRTEALAILAVLSLLMAIVLPALAHDRARSARIICANNLRQISAAQQLWGNDHNDFPPVMVPLNEGGTRVHPLAANAWLHFAWLSNELVTPKVIFCPSDTGKPAEEFTGSPTNGYLNPNFANRATSYFVAYSGINGDPQQAIDRKSVV